VFREGGLDHSFPHHSVEDIEFSFRLATKGYRLVFAPCAKVYHQHPTTLLPYLWRKFRYGYWRVSLYRRYPHKLKGDSHTAPELKYQLAALSGLLLCLPFALWQPVFGFLALTSLVLFIAALLPFVARTGRKDPVIALIAPIIILLRNLAMLGGLGLGLLNQPLIYWGALRANRTRLV
jgi:GT2 family glycosyltransferase